MTVYDDERAAEVRHARGTSGQAPAAGLARDLSELARQMQADPSMTALLQRIVEAAVAEIDSAEHAGISEIIGRELHTRAATDPLVEQIDDMQYRLEEGPCLTSLRDHITVRTDDLREETRWPRFAAAAHDAGVRSMLSVQLFVQDDNLGALNLYANSSHAFDNSHESTAMLLAAHAAIAMRGSKLVNNLRTAMVTRDVIGQAKGILMERYKINQTVAFDLLVTASQHTHRKLHDIAEELAATGELPTLNTPRHD
jgi:transcriptional regulator with GAF, ATPase, and Fis domain